MKRLLSIFLLFAFLFSATELNQFLKLPVMLEHFCEHKTLNKNISFQDFIYMHYTDNDGNDNDNDQDRDMQLPFKSHDDCSAVQAQHIPSHPQTLSIKPIPVSEKNFASYKTQNFNSSYPSLIWQPPKAC